MNETIADSRVVIIAARGETCHQRVIDAFLVVAVVSRALLESTSNNREAVDIDCPPRDGVVSAGSPEVSSNPIRQARTQCFTIAARAGEDPKQSRLGRLAGQALLEDAIARPIPGGQPQRWIVRQPIQVVGRGVSQNLGEDPLSQELDQLVADLLGIARIGELSCEALGQTETMIRLPDQNDARVGSQSLIP